MLGAGVARRKARLLVRLLRDSLRTTYLTGVAEEREPGGLPVPVSAGTRAVPDEVAGHYVDHRFDVLGSGWVTVRPGMECRGVVGHRYENATGGSAGRTARHQTRGNRREAARVRALVGPGYEPIDWHLDLKSGWQWSPASWYRRVRTGPAPGADIKVPWELARMQHLPQLALAYRSEASAWHEDPRITSEVRNQILDFVAANPPRYGVNWKCTMDVGIRAANWVLAHGILTAAGARFDDEFEAVFARSIREHGTHIAHNLEKLDGRRANHYLGNIAGLIFCAAFLPRGPETDAWLGYGIRELIAEVEHQFLPDGGHFEGSTAYHRFALDMVVYPAAVVLGLGGERPAAATGEAGRGDGDRFPAWWWERIERAYGFLRAVEAPGGELVQVGDNDSGWLFKPCPRFTGIPVPEAQRRYANLAGYDALPDSATYWVEDHLDAAGTLAAVEALLGRDSPGGRGADDAAARIVSALSRGATRAGLPAAAPRPAATGSWGAGGSSGLSAGADPPGQDPVRREFRAASGGLTRELTVESFPEFGCYVFRSSGLYLLVRAWTRPLVHTAHVHSDQLGVTLWIDGDPVIRDPGTFLYTAAPAERDRYRGVGAHDTPWPLHGGEPARLDQGLFINPATPCARVEVGRDGFHGEHEARGIRTMRRIRVLDDHVLIEDWPGRPEPAEGRPPFSPGYGIRETGA